VNLSQKGKTNTAQTISQSSLQPSTTPTASAQLANVDYSSDGSAFNTYINCESSNIQFIIDSGASHHMVNSASLLANLQPLSPVKQIRIGNGTHLAAIAIGTLQIGDTTFANALLVPKLASTLVSVGATPSGYRWDFAQHQARLCNQQTTLLTAIRSMTSCCQGKPIS